MLRAYLSVRDDSFNPVSSLSLKAAIQFDAQQGEKRSNLPVTIARDPSAPGVYELNAIARDEGNGELSAELEAKESSGQVGIRFSVQAKKSEWREPFDASERLARAAQMTGGELISADQFDMLKSRLLELQTENRASPVVHHLRLSIALAFLLPLLMACEYFLRRRCIGD
jgi:hypothetical protein